MSELGKVVTTIAIWSAVTGIMVLGQIGEHNAVWGLVILGVAATVSTLAIWVGSDTQSDNEKIKRSNRTSRLVERLDEEEIADLEDLLAARREDRLIDDSGRR